MRQEKSIRCHIATNASEHLHQVVNQGTVKDSQLAS